MLSESATLCKEKIQAGEDTVCVGGGGRGWGVGGRGKGKGLLVSLTTCVGGSPGRFAKSENFESAQKYMSCSSSFNFSLYNDHVYPIFAARGFQFLSKIG